MMLSDITFYNLVALIETEGYGVRDYMYYVKDPGLGIEGMQEIEDDDMLEEILDHIVQQKQKIFNVTVVRASSPKPVDINSSANVIEQQIPLQEIGEPQLYQVDEEGVLFNAHPSSVSNTAAVVPVEEPRPIQFQTQQSTNNSEEQLQIEKVMEERRRKEIAMFRKNEKEKEKVTHLKRKATVMDNEEDSDDDNLSEYGDILARLEEMKKQRDDPLLHYEGDTDVEEMWDTDEEEELYDPSGEEEDNDDQEEEELEELEEVVQGEKHNEEEQESGQHIQKKNKAKRDRKGPTSRSHGSVEQMFEDDWIPSDDEDKKPLDLGLEDDDGAEAMAYVLPNGERAEQRR